MVLEAAAVETGFDQVAELAADIESRRSDAAWSIQTTPSPPPPPSPAPVVANHWDVSGLLSLHACSFGVRSSVLAWTACVTNGGGRSVALLFIGSVRGLAWSNPLGLVGFYGTGETDRAESASLVGNICAFHPQKPGITSRHVVRTLAWQTA